MGSLVKTQNVSHFVVNRSVKFKTAKPWEMFTAAGVTVRPVLDTANP